MYPKSKVPPYNTLCSFLWILTNSAQACENVTVCTFERLLRGVTEPGLSWTETFLGRFRKCFSDGSVPTRALWKSSTIHADKVSVAMVGGEVMQFCCIEHFLRRKVVQWCDRWRKCFTKQCVSCNSLCMSCRIVNWFCYIVQPGCTQYMCLAK